MRVASLAVLTWAASAAVEAAGLSFTGTTVTFNSVDYFINPHATGFVHGVRGAVGADRGGSGFGLTPVTVVAEDVALSDLGELLVRWNRTDDVFQRGFVEELILSKAQEQPQKNFEALGTHADVWPLGETEGIVPSGPYFINEATGALYPVYRLCDDFSQSFSASLLQNPDGSFQPLAAQTATGGTLTIGVPSRLYYTPSAEKPLAGVRFGVKDLYHLKGAKTSNGNKAWYHLYPPAEETSPVIQRLIDAGAIVVGFQTPTQFANGDTYAGDWVDYHSPFNPRGDGYQIPAGSSSGSGAAMAAYDWLDVSVGSDTGGSIRAPAAVQGVFGNRPTHGLADLSLVTPLSPVLDTAGLIARDPTLWDRSMKVLYGRNYTSLADDEHVEYPKVLYTVDIPVANGTSVNHLFNKFVTDAAKLMGATVKSINLEQRWAETRPSSAPHVSLDELLNRTYPTLVSMNQARLVGDKFFADYAAKYDGRQPFVNPSARGRWLYADTQPESELQNAYRNKTIFADWFNSVVLPRANGTSGGCSQALLLYPASYGADNRTDTYAGAPPLPFGFEHVTLSSMSGVPDVVFPLGDVQSLSGITGKKEALPVGISVLGARGCDGLITRLAMDMVKADKIRIPDVGRSTRGGNVLFRRDGTEELV